MSAIEDELACASCSTASELQQLLGSIAGDQSAMDAFVSVIAGTLSPPAFFAAFGTRLD